MIYIFEQITILFLLVLWCFIMSRFDLRNLSVPNWPYFAGCISLLVARLIFSCESLYLYVISALALAGLYFLVRLVTRGHLGTGDTYFGFVQGLCLTPKALWICVAAEVLAAFFYAIIRFKTIKGIKFAFIPFMSIGLLTAFLIDWFVL